MACDETAAGRRRNSRGGWWIKPPCTGRKAGAEKPSTDVPIAIFPDTHRWNVIDRVTGHENIGIELGVAAGAFSARMVQSGKFHQFFGVDVYGDTHDITEYKKALRTVGLRSNYHLLRMTFDDALDVF